MAMKWQFDCNGTALGTRIGQRHDNAIQIRARRGCALHGPYLPVPAGNLRARVLLAAGGQGTVTMEIAHDGGAERLTGKRIRVSGQRFIEQEVELSAQVEDLEVRVYCRGKSEFSITGLEIELEREHRWVRPEPSRPVGVESGKSYATKLREGFFDRYLSGPAVMEVGYQGYDHKTVPIVPQAVGVDVGYPGYDGRSFPFADGTLDAIYSSHCYEHIPDYRAVLRDWFRLLKIGGFLVIVVPHQYLFERKRQMPSRWNPDHQRFYTPRSLLGELEAALDENSYRIRHLVENYAGFDYTMPPRKATSGCYEIELVIEKITPPNWLLDDGTVRPYSPADFEVAPTQARVSPYEVRLDLTVVDCLVWGPYNRLAPGNYEAEFFFDGTSDIPVEMMLDVARESVAFASVHARFDSDTDRHSVVVPFTNEKAEAFFEFRVWNRSANAEARLSFRGVELRYAS